MVPPNLVNFFLYRQKRVQLFKLHGGKELLLFYVGGSTKMSELRGAVMGEEWEICSAFTPTSQRSPQGGGL